MSSEQSTSPHNEPRQSPIERQNPMATGFNNFIDHLARQAAIEQVSPHEFELLKKLNENNLPPNVREIQKNANERLTTNTNTFNEALSRMKNNYMQIITRLFDPTISDEIRHSLQESVQGTLEDISTMSQLHQELLDMVKIGHQREVDYLETAQIDKSTGLFTRRVLMDQFRTYFSNFLDGNELPKARISAVDLLNFKVGNDILTPSGFDVFFRGMCKGFIGVSRELGDETSTYGQLSSADLECANELQKYFYRTIDNDGEKNKKRIEDGLKLFNQVRERGIKITMFRDKSGGDEAYFEYKLTREYTSREEEEADYALGKKLVNHIMGASEIDRHPPETLEKIVEIIKTLPEIIKQKIEKSNNDFSSIRQLLQFIDYSVSPVINAQAEEIQTDAECKISMGYAEEEGNYDEALVIFFTGKDLEGNQLYDKDEKPTQGLMNFDPQTGIYTINSERMNKYRKSLADRIRIRLSNGNLTEASIKNLVRNIVSDDVFGSYLERKNDLVEKRAKPADKRRLLISALKGTNVQDLYQIGALIKSGRIMGDFSDDEFFDIMKEIQMNYN